MQFFPLRRLEKITNKGLPGKLKADEADVRILKTMRILRAAKKLHGSPLFSRLSTWYLSEGDIGPGRRIVDCEGNFIQGVKDNPNYEIKVNAPLNLTTASGKVFVTNGNIATITYSLKSGRKGNPFQAELDELGKPGRRANRVFGRLHIKKLVDECRSFVMIQLAYDFDAAYKEAGV